MKNDKPCLKGVCFRLLALAALLALSPASRGAEPLTHAAKITFDSAGALVVDGQKVFPINLTVIPPPEAKAPNGKPAYAEFRDGGAWGMRTGGPHWNEQTLETELHYQQGAAQCGMRCCPWMGWELCNIKPGDTQTEQQLRDIIARLKDSPGLGLWKGADEPEWGKKKPEDVANSARIFHETDPNHPIWLVQAPRGTVASLKRYDAGWDVGGIDIYPVSYPPGKNSLLDNKDLSMVGDYARMMRAVAGKKPFWMTLQIAFSGTTPPKNILRFPTFFEERFMAYDAVINGSRGLTFFGGGLQATLNERDRALGWNWTFWERVLKPLLAEFKSGSPIEAALLAPESPLPLKLSVEQGPEKAGVSTMEWLVREAGDEVYLFAAAKEGPTLQVRFAGLPTSGSTGQVLFEEPRQVEVKGGSFTDWFGPHEVHVYRFRR